MCRLGAEPCQGAPLPLIPYGDPKQAAKRRGFATLLGRRRLGAADAQVPS